jgi:hypothetical protein
MLAPWLPLAALSDTFDDADQIAERVDLPLMRERYWKDTEDDPDRERRRQAEFLVHDRAPWEVIEEIGVMDAKGRGDPLRYGPCATGNRQGGLVL